MKKQIFKTLAALTLIFSIGISNPAKTYAMSFTDVAADHWARYYIMKMEQMKIINGYGDGTFKPEDLVTTGEFIKMVAMSYYPDYQYVAPSPDEEDGCHWSKPYVLLLHGELLNAGDYNDERMDRIITRGETTSILCYLYAFTNVDDPEKSRFDRSEEYIKQLADEADITDLDMRVHINTCIKNGIINGFPDGTFRKDEGLTRAQAAKIIYYARYSL